MVVLIQAELISGLLFTYIALVTTLRPRLTARALEIRLLGMTVRRVGFAEIEEVHRRGALIHEPWAGPRFWNAVTIRRRRGLIRNLVVTPDEPDRFVALLREAILQAGATPATGS